MNKRVLVLLAMLSGAILLMAGCGQKGALFLPGDAPNELPKAAPPADAQ
ncbi:MAG: lipoprotein [Bermanella sp.]